MIRLGVVHGRFQPLHHDHLKYILCALGNCDVLYIGITNPDTLHVASHESDKARSEVRSNPMNFWERKLSIERTLLDLGIESSKFSVVPFPIDDPPLLGSYVPTTATFFMTIYDDWGRHKEKILRSLGVAVTVLWHKPLAEKGITASEVRQLIAAGQPWTHLVPSAVARTLKEYHIDDRIQKLHAQP